MDLAAAAFNPRRAPWGVFWGSEPCVVKMDRFLPHRMFGSLLSYSRLVPYIQRTLVPKRGRSSISNKQRGLRRCRSFP